MQTAFIQTYSTTRLQTRGRWLGEKPEQRSGHWVKEHKQFRDKSGGEEGREKMGKWLGKAAGWDGTQSTRKALTENKHWKDPDTWRKSPVQRTLKNDSTSSKAELRGTPTQRLLGRDSTPCPASYTCVLAWSYCNTNFIWEKVNSGRRLQNLHMVLIQALRLKHGGLGWEIFLFLGQYTHFLVRSQSTWPQIWDICQNSHVEICDCF